MNNETLSHGMYKNPVYLDETDHQWHYMQRSLTDGMEIIFSCDERGYSTYEEAEDAYIAHENKFREHLRIIKNQSQHNVDFHSELLSWYHNIFLSRASGSTVMTTSYVLYHFILPNLGNLGKKPLPQITQTDVENLVKQTSGFCTSSAPQTQKFLRYFFNDMQLANKIKENPTSCIEIRNTTSVRKEVPAYTEKEFQKLLYGAVNTDHYFEIFLLAMGLRYGEIRGLTYNDFHKKDNTLHIQRQVTGKREVTYTHDSVRVSRVGIEIKAPKKYASNRIIRVPSITFDLLAERKRRLKQVMESREARNLSWDHNYDPFVCVSELGGTIKSDATLNEALKRICSDQGIPVVSTHDIRHIVATLMFEYGTDGAERPDVMLEKVSKYLGHSSVNTTFDIYIDYVQSRSKVAEIMDQSLNPFQIKKREQKAVRHES
jgi:integrase